MNRRRKRVPCWDLCHPLILVIYFAVLLFVVTFLRNPFYMLTALPVIFWIRTCQNPDFSPGRALLGLVLVMGLLALVNPLISHNGKSLLAFVGGQAYTLEAMIYGAVMGLMLMTSFHGFMALASVMTEERWMALTGRLFPKTTLMIMMILRTIPLLIRQGKTIEDSAVLIESLPEKDSPRYAIRRFFIKLDHLIGWVLENGLITADSMAARGFGSPKRKSLHTLRWYGTDTVRLAALGILLAGFVVLEALSKPFTVYPALAIDLSLPSLGALLVWCLWCAFVLTIQRIDRPDR